MQVPDRTRCPSTNSCTVRPLRTRACRAGAAPARRPPTQAEDRPAGSAPAAPVGCRVPHRCWTTAASSGALGQQPGPHTTAMRTTSGNRRANTKVLGSWVPITTTTRTARPTAPSMTRIQARRLVRQRSAFADTERVQRHQHHGLDGDAAEDVADRDVKLAAGCGGVGDRDLRPVGGHGQPDQAAEGRTEVEPVGQDVGVVRQREPGYPDCRRAGDSAQKVTP